MSDNAATLERTRRVAIEGFAATMQAIGDKQFMAGVFESLAQLQSGDRGKTLAEIREEYGLAD